MTKLLMVVAVLAACGKEKDEADEYVRKSKAIEAKLHLNRLSKYAKLHLAEHGEFPKGTAGPLPAETCCKSANGTCARVAYETWSADPVWSALDFAVDEPARFQYAYQSDGKTITATATGDLDCDGKPLVFKLEMAAIPDANVDTKLIEPAMSAD